MPSVTWTREPLLSFYTQTFVPTHRLWERCDVNCRFLQFSAVWALLYEHCVRVLARSPLVVKKTKQTSRDKAVRSTATSVGLGRFSFPWDSADGSFIRLGVKVTVASECFLYPAGMWQTQGLWDCSEIQVTDRSQDFLVRNTGVLCTWKPKHHLKVVGLY